MKGFYTFSRKGVLIERIPNTIVKQGEEAFLKMLLRHDETIVAGGANFYLGLCNHVPAAGDNLAAITDEPSGAGGYAREAIVRSAVGFPTISEVNGKFRALSVTVNFAASGADFSDAITRAFLCNVASGTAGILFGFSGQLTDALLIEDGQDYDVNYELYLD